MEAVKTITNAQTHVPAAEKVVQKKEGEQSFTPLFYQPKLTIGSPDDPLEKEADDMADKVMRMEMPSPINFSSAKNSVNRKCAHCEEEEEKQVQRKESSGDSVSAAPSIVHDVINSSGGRSMDTDTRSFMESRFNYDFSGVQIHDGDLAAKSASSINALAYTSGNNVVFNSRQYNTTSDSGKRLLAHELTHVVQQNGASKSSIQRKDMPLNASVVAVQLRDAMEGWGTDEDAIYAALAGRTPEQTNEIATAYRTLTNRNLQADLEDELTRDELLRLANYGSWPSNSRDRAAAVAVRLRDAMSGWGTDENAINVALQGRSEEELRLIREEYLRLTSRQLMDDLRDELTDSEFRIATGTMGISPDLSIRNTELGMLSMGNFDFILNNCQITIAVRVKFQFTDNIIAADQATFKTRFINAIHSGWQNTGFRLIGSSNCPCDQIPININVTVRIHKLPCRR